VEQRGRDRLVVEPQLCADLGRSPGVEDEILARATLLALVCAETSAISSSMSSWCFS